MKVSKYANANTEINRDIIKGLTKSNLPTLKDIEAFQLKNGVSDTDLAQLIYVDKSWVSQLKKGKRELPDYIAALFRAQALNFQ